MSDISYEWALNRGPLEPEPVSLVSLVVPFTVAMQEVCAAFAQVGESLGLSLARAFRQTTAEVCGKIDWSPDMVREMG